MEVGGWGHALAYLSSEKRPGALCIADWVDPRAGLQGCEKSRPHQYPISAPGSP